MGVGFPSIILHRIITLLLSFNVRIRLFRVEILRMLILR